MTRLEDLERELQAEETYYANIRLNHANIKYISNPLWHLIPVALFFIMIGWFRDLFGFCIGLVIVGVFYVFVIFRQSGNITNSSNLLSASSMKINHLRHAINIERMKL